MNLDEAKQRLFNSSNNTYFAGLPGYEKNFSRDVLIQGLLTGDKDLLLAQIEYSALLQGVEYNPETGEEPGKIHHEYPDGSFRGRSTTYNACDTNALFIIAISRLVNRQGETELLDRYSEQIEDAVGYILNHIEASLFYEDPSICGAEDFALRVTYWKDSVLNSEQEEPRYPTVYSLVHFMSAYALQQIGRLTENQRIIGIGDQMKAVGIDKLWRNDHFVAAIDDSIDVDAPSSDSLHALLYIEPAEINKEYVKKIFKYSKQLETKAGYRSGIAGDISDTYHTQFVWVFEQALLHAAATKHGLVQAAAVTRRVLSYIGDVFPELIDIENDFAPAGNDPQLWSVGAVEYFKDINKSYLV